LPRIHDAARVQRTLDLTHKVQLDGTRVALQLTRLQLPDAVLGAEAPAVRGDQIMDRAPDGGFQGRHRCGRGLTRETEVEVQVPGSSVPVGNECGVRNRG